MNKYQRRQTKPGSYWKGKGRQQRYRLLMSETKHEYSRRTRKYTCKKYSGTRFHMFLYRELQEVRQRMRDAFTFQLFGYGPMSDRKPTAQLTGLSSIVDDAGTDWTFQDVEGNSLYPVRTPYEEAIARMCLPKSAYECLKITGA